MVGESLRKPLLLVAGINAISQVRVNIVTIPVRWIPADKSLPNMQFGKHLRTEGTSTPEQISRQ